MTPEQKPTDALQKTWENALKSAGYSLEQTGASE